MKKKDFIQLTDHDRKALVDMRDNLVEMHNVEAEKAMVKIKEYLKKYDFSSDLELKYSLMMKLGEVHGRNAEVKKSAEYLKAILNSPEAQVFTRYIRKAKANLAITLAMQDLYREALDMWHGLLEDEKDIDMKLNLYNNICVAYGIIGEYHDCIHYAYQAMELADKHGMPERRMEPLLNLGASYEKMGDPKKAMKYWMETLDLSRKFKSVRREFETLGNIALAYVELKEYNKALEYAFDALNLRKVHLPEESLGISYNNIGFIYEASGNLEEALKYYKMGEQWYQKLRRDSALANCLINQASLYYKMGDLPESLAKLEEASEIENALNVMQNYSKITSMYAKVYAAMGDHQKAFEYSEKNNSILENKLDSLLKTTISKKEAEYYRGKIEEQARKYLEQNNELKTKNSIISASTRELKVVNKSLAENVEVLNWLISVISHDVRAPITNFSRMLAMINSGDFPPEEHDEILQSMKRSSDSIVKLINEMLDGIRLQRQNMSFHTSIGMQNIVPILNSVMEIYQPMALQKKIKLSFSPQTEEMYARVDADLLKILVRNLLNNAMKFTGDNGKVDVYAKAQKSKVEIVVEDNGIGMDATALKDLRKGQGIARSKLDGSVGLGLVLCRDSLKKMKGSIKIDSTQGKGTRVSILLPAK
ncbi:MAG: tetratricopeptide repeat-containing sensor histidine kinase [Candidatus Cloacimonetes bacterium]|nr:tetratricopeptide repeat-containing sensor histidine kinase [Candidatus Cloacimonadota bacterium]